MKITPELIAKIQEDAKAIGSISKAIDNAGIANGSFYVAKRRFEKASLLGKRKSAKKTKHISIDMPIAVPQANNIAIIYCQIDQVKSVMESLNGYR